MFFTRAALPMVHHVTAGGPARSDLKRHALLYRAKPGCGTALARLLAGQDEAAADDPSSQVDSSTIFQRDDIVVRLIEVDGPLDTRPSLALGIEGPRKAAVLSRLLDGPANTVPASDREISRFLTDSEMQLITDRQSQKS